MSIPILYHSALVLMATVYPVSVPQIMQNFTRRYNNKNQDVIYLASCVVISGVLLLLSCVLVPIGGNIILTAAPLWYITAALAAPLLIAVEFGVGGILLRASGIKVKGISVNASWKKLSAAGWVLTLLLAVIEELIYRQLWSVAILEHLGWGTAVFVALSALCYGFNHLYYGFSTFLQKTLSGTAYAALFLLSGGCILVPVLAHALQNLIILMMGRRQKNG